MPAKPSFLATDTDEEGFTPDEREKMAAAPEAEDETPQEPEGDKEPEAEPKRPDKPEKPEHRGGDLGVALREAREESKGLRDRLAKVEGAWQTIQQRMNQPPQQPQQQPKQDEVPEFDKDPLGNLRAVNQQLAKQLETFQRQQTMTTEQQRQYAETMAHQDRYTRIEQDYARRNPTYSEAKQFYKDHWDGVLTEMGYDDPAERENILGFWEGRIAGDAMLRGRNPADAFMKAALKVGYKPKGAEPEPNKLERLQKGAKASSSLSSTKTPPNGNSLPSLEEYAALMETDPDAADKLWDRMAKAGMLG